MGLSPDFTQIFVGIYDVLIAGGGVSAYARTKSKMSLGTSLIAALAPAFSSENTRIALGTAVALGLAFTFRYAKSRNNLFGILCAVSLVFASMFGYAIFV